MKFFNSLILLIVLSSCKDKPVNPIDNALVANWKMVSVTSNTGSVTTNPTASEIITIFNENSNKFDFQNNGSSGSGTYTLSKNNGMSITVTRGDKGGWPNGSWLDLYLETMNKAQTYQLNSQHLSIKTSDNRTILFSKL
jgi:hypothetical protein